MRLVFVLILFIECNGDAWTKPWDFRDFVKHRLFKANLNPTKSLNDNFKTRFLNIGSRSSGSGVMSSLSSEAQEPEGVRILSELEKATDESCQDHALDLLAMASTFNSDERLDLSEKDLKLVVRDQCQKLVGNIIRSVWTQKDVLGSATSGSILLKWLQESTGACVDMGKNIFKVIANHGSKAEKESDIGMTCDSFIKELKINAMNLIGKTEAGVDDPLNAFLYFIRVLFKYLNIKG